jgi:hypothetical protein
MNRFNCPAERVRGAVDLRLQRIDEIASAAFGTSARGICESERRAFSLPTQKPRAARPRTGWLTAIAILNSPSPVVPKGRPIIARPFQGRARRHPRTASPGGTAETEASFSRASGTGLLFDVRFPASELAGYFRRCLRHLTNPSSFARPDSREPALSEVEGAAVPT